MVFTVITQVYITENKKALHMFSERNLRVNSVYTYVIFV